MRSLVSALALLSDPFLTATLAAAQSIARPNSWTLTPVLHGSLAVGDPAPENSFGLGFAVGYDWTSNLGFEGELSHLFDVAGDSADVDWSVTTFSGNAIYHFDARHVTPYATLGLGFEHSGHSRAACYVDVRTCFWSYVLFATCAPAFMLRASCLVCDVPTCGLRTSHAGHAARRT
jgi:Outer membrane protein beta-barrel domain